MKVVILAGGRQSSLNARGEGIPKPMVEIGGRPLLWHIMKHFSQYGLNEFVVCGGYRVDRIKDYFKDFYIYGSDITVDLRQNTIEIHEKRTEDWKVTVVDTGLDTTQGQRILIASRYLSGEDDADSDFLVTYGDSLSDIDAEALVEAHKRSGKLVTIVMAKPQGRKRLLGIDENGLLDYEKTSPMVNKAAWVNADCFIMNRKALDYLSGSCSLEMQIFRKLSAVRQVAAYRHEGYCITVETMRDLEGAECLWNEGCAPWVV